MQCAPPPRCNRLYGIEALAANAANVCFRPKADISIKEAETGWGRFAKPI